MKKLIKKFINIFKKEKNPKPAAPIFACSFTPSNPLTEKDCDQKIQVRTFIDVDRELDYLELQNIRKDLKGGIFYDETIKKMFKRITEDYIIHRSYFKSIGEELGWDTKTPDEWLNELRKLECENDNEVTAGNFRLIRYHYASQIKNFLSRNHSGFMIVPLLTLIPPYELDHCVDNGNWGTTAKTRRDPRYPDRFEHVGEVIATEKFQICTYASHMKIAEVERPIKSSWKFALTPLAHGSSSNDVGLDNIFESAVALELWSIVYYNHVGSYAKPILFKSNNDGGFNEIKVEFINKAPYSPLTKYFDSMEDLRDYCIENGLHLAPIYPPSSDSIDQEQQAKGRVKTKSSKKKEK